jgi:hypothetical protein
MNLPRPRHPVIALGTPYRHFHTVDGVNTLQTAKAALGHFHNDSKQTVVGNSGSSKQTEIICKSD